MQGDSANQNTQLGGVDWNGPLQIGDDAVRGWFALEETKAAAHAAQKTPATTYAVLIGGVLLLILLLKK